MSREESGKPKPTAKKTSAVVGTWHGIAGTVGTIEIHPDGTYTYGGSPGGRYSVNGSQVVFSGNLSSWNGGTATIKDGNLEFYWTNDNGAINYFVFAR